MTLYSVWFNLKNIKKLKVSKNRTNQSYRIGPYDNLEQKFVRSPKERSFSFLVYSIIAL